MLNLSELRRAADIIDRLFAGHRLERSVQAGDDRVVLTLYGPQPEDPKARKRLLLLTCHGQGGRVSQVDALPKAPQNPPAFVSWLRAHLASARLRGARVVGDDRALALAFEAREGRFELLLSLLGKRSNLYILDEGGQVILALRPPARTRPEIVPGAVFAPPASGLPSPGVDRFAEAPDGEFLSAIEANYSADEDQREVEGAGREIRKVLKREAKNAERRLAKIESELAEADQAGELQRHGELLKASLSEIRPGASEIRVRDFETDEEVTIALDPRLGPRENLEATFKRYQKFVRRLTKAGGKEEEARAWLEKIRGFVAQLEAAEGTDEEPAVLEALAADEALARLLGRRRAARSEAGSAPAEQAQVPARFRGLPRKLHPRRYLSRDELEIWVGRSDEGNDYLTTRLARGKDLFFHLDGAPGSHVVLRTEGRDEPPPESVLDACELAVHFSKQKNAGHADVHVVPIKQVSKPRGAKKGLVYVTGGRSIRLRREEARLRRLLDARLEP